MLRPRRFLGVSVADRAGLGLSVLHQVEKGLVHAAVVGEFGMKSGSHRTSLPDRDRVATLGGDDFDVGTDALNFRGADEDHFQRRVTEQTLADGTVDLTPVRIAPDA